MLEAIPVLHLNHAYELRLHFAQYTARILAGDLGKLGALEGYLAIPFGRPVRHYASRLRIELTAAEETAAVLANSMSSRSSPYRTMMRFLVAAS